MKITAIIPAIVLIAAVGAQANDEPAERSKDETLECRFERVTGTRTKAYRVCLTKADWNRRSVDEREELEKYLTATTQWIGRAY